MRPYAPLAALVGLATLALVMAAQAGLAFCNARVALPAPAMAAMSGMSGMSMDMPAGTTMHHVAGICPVVLVLIVACTVLAAFAIVTIVRDPHRELTQRTLVRSLAALPLLRTTGILAVLGALAIGAMLAVDGSGPPPLPGAALLAALLAGGSLAATLLSLLAGRVASALGERVLLALAAALLVLRDAATHCIVAYVPARAIAAPAELLAAGRGLRAPPPFVR